ncbi:DMT family transporter [Flavobacteriaceae bacterium S0825]|uniref:DMT family transporter n=1 Tax=Gaetbulibacter sp. S0825 TaxID=2720084 RepID=UPI00142FE348|nr:DMT family transporter [Gaetbulibacter sp. S0825]MCK0107959.1 DMT family transporter [Flavobacteriaceae bacterium S0825]NIX63595.1 DMT family transporter [Gaetbulibacter sp. S0825]
MLTNTHKAHLALLGANVIYGANYLIAKGIMPNKIGPSAFVFIRLFCGVILFWIIKFFIKERIAKKDMLRLALCGLLGAAANQLLFFNGLNLTSPIDASIIITSIPVMVLIFSAFILKEKITLNKLLGITIGGIGAVLLIWYGNTAEGTSSFLGNLLVFLNACCYGLYLVIVKPLMKKYNSITLISWVFLFGFVFMFPFGISDLLSTDFSSFDLNTYLVITFVVIFTTFFAYLFNIYALNYVSPSVNSSYVYLQPAVSFIMVSIYAYVLMHDEYAQDINLIKILSSLLVVSGVYLISRKAKLT